MSPVPHTDLPLPELPFDVKPLFDRLTKDFCTLYLEEGTVKMHQRLKIAREFHAGLDNLAANWAISRPVFSATGWREVSEIISDIRPDLEILEAFFAQRLNFHMNEIQRLRVIVDGKPTLARTVLDRVDLAGADSDSHRYYLVGKGTGSNQTMLVDEVGIKFSREEIAADLEFLRESFQALADAAKQVWPDLAADQAVSMDAGAVEARKLSRKP